MPHAAGKRRRSSLVHLSGAGTTIKRDPTPATSPLISFGPGRDASLAAAAAHLSVSCCSSELHLGRITRYYKYQAVWPERSGTHLLHITEAVLSTNTDG